MEIPDTIEPQLPYLVRRAVTRNQTALSKMMAEMEGNPDAERPPLIDAQILTMTMDDNIRTRNRFNDAQREVMMKLDLYDKEMAEKKAKEQALLRDSGKDDGAAASPSGQMPPSAASGVIPEQSVGGVFGQATQQQQQPVKNVGDGDGVPANQQQPNLVDISVAAVQPALRTPQPSAFYPMHDFVGPVPPPQDATGVTGGAAAMMNFEGGNQQVGAANGPCGGSMQTESGNVAMMFPGGGVIDQRTPQGAVDGAAMMMYGPAQQPTQGVVVGNDGAAAVFGQQQGNNNVAPDGEQDTWFDWMKRFLKQELF